MVPVALIHEWLDDISRRNQEVVVLNMVVRLSAFRCSQHFPCSEKLAQSCTQDGALAEHSKLQAWLLVGCVPSVACDCEGLCQGRPQGQGRSAADLHPSSMTAQKVYLLTAN